MKSVLISIKPKWCALIAQGKKTIEVRKTVPKLRNRVKCYIYCTKAKQDKDILEIHNEDTREITRIDGKVIGEFILDEIITFEPRIYKDDGSLPWDSDCIIYACDKRTCLTGKQFEEYGKGKTLYGWHISQLKIYDKPKELNEFWCIKCTKNYKTCGECKDKPKCIKTITRPPQSWCYVEDKNLYKELNRIIGKGRAPKRYIGVVSKNDW